MHLADLDALGAAAVYAVVVGVASLGGLVRWRRAGRIAGDPAPGVDG